MRANRKCKDKPYYRIVMPITYSDFDKDDIGKLVKTFCDIDVKIKDAIKNKSKTRIKIRCNGDKDTDTEAELLYESIYDRMGQLIGRNGFDEWKTLLFEYCDNNNSVPQRKIKYHNKNISTWLGNQKNKINSSTDELYTTLSVNKHVKQSLDKYLDKKVSSNVIYF